MKILSAIITEVSEQNETKLCEIFFKIIIKRKLPTLV